jgi:hypothetical protein
LPVQPTVRRHAIATAVSGRWTLEYPPCLDMLVSRCRTAVTLERFMGVRGVVRHPASAWPGFVEDAAAAVRGVRRDQDQRHRPLARAWVRTTVPSP